MFGCGKRVLTAPQVEPAASPRLTWGAAKESSQAVQPSRVWWRLLRRAERAAPRRQPRQVGVAEIDCLLDGVLVEVDGGAERSGNVPAVDECLDDPKVQRGLPGQLPDRQFHTAG